MDEASNPSTPQEVSPLFLGNETDRLAKDGSYVTVERVLDERTELPVPTKVEVVFPDMDIATAAVQEMTQRLDIDPNKVVPDTLDIRPGFSRVLHGYGGLDMELNFIELETPKHPPVTHEWAVTLKGTNQNNLSKTSMFDPNAIIYLREKGWLLPIEYLGDKNSLKGFLNQRGINVPLKLAD